MSTVKVGQVWRDKDKRRNTVIEILSVATDKHGSAEAIGLVVGTEETRSYNEERLVKRWELVQTKNPTITDDPATGEGVMVQVKVVLTTMHAGDMAAGAEPADVEDDS